MSGGLLQAAAPPLVLASASLARRKLLGAAGLRFDVSPAGVDEAAIRGEAAILEASAEQTALRLARLKAQSVVRPGAIVLGCDQILVCEGLWFDKPANLDAARVHLQSLRGRTHSLATAAVALREGVEVWRHVAAPRLTMRRFTDNFMETYLAEEGERLLASVGAYRLEGLGLHLFESIEGEHSAILGLPMLPLLHFLRGCGILTA